MTWFRFECECGITASGPEPFFVGDFADGHRQHHPTHRPVPGPITSMADAVTWAVTAGIPVPEAHDD